MIIEHRFADGALVCNCGKARTDGASPSAPAGWPGNPSSAGCGPTPRCDRCAHWEAFEADLQPGTVGGIMERLRALGAWPEGLVPGVLGDCLLSTEASSLLVAEDDPTVTQGDFGCVMFKEKT